MPVTQFPDEWLAQSLEGLVTPELLTELRAKAESGRTMWEMLVAQKVATDEQILGKLSTRFRLKIADVSQIDAQVKEGVPEQLARRYRILPIRLTDSFLELATANPFDLDAEKALAFATAREIRMLLLAPSKIAEKLDEMYRPEKALDKLLEGMGDSEVLTTLKDAPPEELTISEEEASQRPVVRLVDLIISEGILSRSSDIHIEPEEGGVAVRYRIDGVLRQVMKIPRNAGLPLISRIKIMSSLDIADRMRPQDGRARVAVNGQPIDLRVSTLPAAQGEKVVIRILDSRATVKTLESLGFNPGETESINQLLANKEGVILVTGPTGSGKTTTLYSMINQIKTEGVNIVTVEDPVEYRMQGIVQVQVQEKAGLTFGSALRSILRQDPNVILVGEIRDKETAQIAVQASLTGHLVLSTLHTNDAANAVTRLVDIGVEAYKIAAALRGVIAQRLMRKLCPTCKEVW
ncbi:MAG TPA: ATPase, T2SS/T4P/T4SS family, partial [Gemmatimonadales bacterium]|nr:ATPase, T2SS/T4P/T4SS family [Gemmatimonadales bacterium]